MSAFKELKAKIKEHAEIRATDGSDPIAAVEVGAELWSELVKECAAQGTPVQEEPKGFFLDLATPTGTVKVRSPGGLMPRQIVTFG